MFGSTARATPAQSPNSVRSSDPSDWALTSGWAAPPSTAQPVRRTPASTDWSAVAAAGERHQYCPGDRHGRGGGLLCRVGASRASGGKLSQYRQSWFLHQRFRTDVVTRRSDARSIVLADRG